ncbi:MAG: type II toxin-antitoxin system Phd/YefM family antitoxin [Planctomycetes bacterium]|nr:type II toxin-antitoxin system Phd/YefM family antitoxin [Planctomycetota bacterium]
MIRTTDITSFTEYRKRLKEHHSMVKETGRPLYVTNKGETEAVVLSPDAFNELLDLAEMPQVLALMEKSLSDIEAGRVIDAKEALLQIAEKHNLKLES